MRWWEESVPTGADLRIYISQVVRSMRLFSSSRQQHNMHQFLAIPRHTTLFAFQYIHHCSEHCVIRADHVSPQPSSIMSHIPPRAPMRRLCCSFGLFLALCIGVLLPVPWHGPWASLRWNHHTHCYPLLSYVLESSNINSHRRALCAIHRPAQSVQTYQTTNPVIAFIGRLCFTVGVATLADPYAYSSLDPLIAFVTLF